MLVEEFEPSSATEDELRAWYAHDSAIEAEQLGPGLPLMPYEESTQWVRHASALRPRRHWIVRDGSTVVGSAQLAWWSNQADANCDLMVSVARTHRRRGLGTKLLRVAADGAREAGRDLAGLEVVVGGVGEAFAARLGAERKQVERRSMCAVADVDRALLDSWVAAAPVAEYELLTWRGAMPEEHLAELARVKGAINDAPLDGLQQGTVIFDATVERDYEAGAAQRGQQLWGAAARHRATGQMAGVTQLLVPSHWPAMAYQENTAVDPPHRCRGIGRWIKAALLLELMRDRPETEYVQTWNAGSNAAMLSINVAMGFRPAEEWGIWQVPVAVLLDRPAA